MNRKAVKATCQGQASCGETNGSHQRNHGKTTASFSAASDDREIPWSKPYPGYLHTRLSYVVMLQGPFPDIQTGLASWLSTSSAKMCHYSRQVISFYQRGTPLQGRSFWTGPACDGPWIHWIPIQAPVTGCQSHSPKTALYFFQQYLSSSFQ